MIEFHFILISVPRWHATISLYNVLEFELSWIINKANGAKELFHATAWNIFYVLYRAALPALMSAELKMQIFTAH